MAGFTELEKPRRRLSTSLVPTGEPGHYEIRVVGEYPRHWLQITLKLDGGPSEAWFDIAAGQGFSRDLKIKIAVPKSGWARVLLKLPLLSQKFTLRVDPAVTVKHVQLAEFSRLGAAGYLFLRALGDWITHPSELISVGKEVVFFYRKSGRAGAASILKERLLSGSVRLKVSYDLWVENFDTLDDERRAEIRKRIADFKYQPKISVLVPVYDPDERWLRKAIESVERQLYPNWELCLSDDASPRPHVRRVLEEFAAKDSRIKVIFREKNGHISESSNSALSLVTGDFVALLDHDDELTEHALYYVADELQRHPDADLIYSDEDKITTDGVRFQPHFKPDWNDSLFYSLNLVTHLAVFRASLLRAIGGFRKGFEGSQDYDLVLRTIEKTERRKIRHIPRVLYHWRAIPGSTAIGPESKMYAHEAARNAIREHLARKGLKARVEEGYGAFHRVRFELPEKLPKVSAIIGTRDRVELLRVIVDGLLNKTDYPDLEILIVDNQSKEKATLDYFAEITSDPRVKVLRYDAPFNFSAINNLAAKTAQGEYLALLNNDLEVIHPDWLKEMMQFALLKDVGAVGAKLYFPNDTIQHAGVILGIGGVAGHINKDVPRTRGGYMSRSMLIQDFSAVTGACLLTPRRLYEKVGGLDEANLAVAFNDIDYCLKIRELGYRVVMTPYAELYHHESVSRGCDMKSENRGRFEKELIHMQNRWGKILYNDPYYNPNFTLEYTDYSLSYPPRVEEH